MSQHSRNDADEWILNEPDDGEISWADGSTTSSSREGSVKIESYEASPVLIHSRSKTRKPVSTGSSIPQFIMPSIADNNNPFRQRTVARDQDARAKPARDSASKTTNARRTPVRVRRPLNAEGGSSQFAEIAAACFQYTLDIIAKVLRNLKTPISLVLTFYLVLAFIQVIQNLASHTIYSALTPICRVPGVSYLHLPMCHAPHGKHHPQLPSSPSTAPDPEFDALMTVQNQFEAIMSDTTAGISLPMDMKMSEASIRDLRTLVEFFQIPSKHELLHELDGFVETARSASYNLQRFNSRVGRGVDIVLSTARWTQRVLDDMNHHREERGLLPAFISDTILAPFKPLKFTEARLLDQYLQHTHIVSGEIEELIKEAQSLLQVLQNLEHRLEVIHSIAIRDDMHVKGTKDEILAELWTFIGGNKAKLGKVDKQLMLLKQVSQYRKTAFNHVAGTIVKLQGMHAELEELRARIGSTQVLRDEHVPLSVHIDNIKLGVERLEIGRKRARALDEEYTRSILDRANSVRDIRFVEGL